MSGMPEDFLRIWRRFNPWQIPAAEDPSCIFWRSALHCVGCHDLRLGDDFERFAKLKEPWLRKHLKLPNGTPSDDTFRCIFTALDPKGFVISAWASGSGLSLGQLLVDGKSNEITAVPELLRRSKSREPSSVSTP